MARPGPGRPRSTHVGRPNGGGLAFGVAFGGFERVHCAPETASAGASTNRSWMLVHRPGVACPRRIGERLDVKILDSVLAFGHPRGLLPSGAEGMVRGKESAAEGLSPGSFAP
jgi:hypothetical protein